MKPEQFFEINNGSIYDLGMVSSISGVISEDGKYGYKIYLPHGDHFIYRGDGKNRQSAEDSHKNFVERWKSWKEYINENASERVARALINDH